MKTGLLSIVSTPIGNMEDITLRAIRTLKEADIVLCEDTRVSGKLLKQHGIEAKLQRYDAHSSEQVHKQIIDDLLSGKKIALISDAGTPGVSDPGVMLVKGARIAGAQIEVIPGPSAVIAAVALAGVTGNQFSFLGFVPHKKGRQTFFKSLATFKHPVVFFESTHRVMKTLESLTEQTPKATIYVARELTKLHEELLTGTAAEILQVLEDEPVKQKGEFVFIVDSR